MLFLASPGNKSYKSPTIDSFPAEALLCDKAKGLSIMLMQMCIGTEENPVKKAHEWCSTLLTFWVFIFGPRKAPTSNRHVIRDGRVLQEVRRKSS